MKRVLVKEYLPDKPGMYLTDLGILTFHIRKYGWSNGCSFHKNEQLIESYPEWWVGPDVEPLEAIFPPEKKKYVRKMKDEYDPYINQD